MLHCAEGLSEAEVKHAEASGRPAEPFGARSVGSSSRRERPESVEPYYNMIVKGYIISLYIIY